MVVDFKNAYTQAKAMARKDAFSHLIGIDYNAQQTEWGKIHDIAIAPYETLNRYIFAWFYTYYNDASRSLNFYTASHYDVLIITRSLDGQNYGFRKLDSYLDGKALPMDVILALKQQS